MATIEIPIIRARQNIGDLYVGVMKAGDLSAIAEADRMRLELIEIQNTRGTNEVYPLGE